ncbi:MAG: hypothetical protein ACRDY7_07520 [Acidimicrobiia bacterium]
MMLADRLGFFAQVDAAVLLEPAISQLGQRTGGVKVLVDTRDTYRNEFL